jgi:hypothetical protein
MKGHTMTTATRARKSNSASNVPAIVRAAARKGRAASRQVKARASQQRLDLFAIVVAEVDVAEARRERDACPWLTDRPLPFVGQIVEVFHDEGEAEDKLNAFTWRNGEMGHDGDFLGASACLFAVRPVVAAFDSPTT